MKSLISDFFKHASQNNIVFYNEGCLQIEMVIYFRSRLPQFHFQVERPITDFRKHRPVRMKKEIDICVIDNDGKKHAIIELKYPKNGKIPETMYDFCKDIEFCEFGVGAGFSKAYAILLTEDKGFWEGNKKDGIYKYFRGTEPINGQIDKPTGNQKTTALISGNYTVEWANAHTSHRYTAIEITENRSGAHRLPLHTENLTV